MGNSHAHPVLRQVFFFRHLDETALGKISKLFRQEVFEPSSVILRAGQAPDSLFIVAAGEVELMCKGKVIATKKVADYFGELCLTETTDRMAHDVVVSSRGPATMLRLPASVYLAKRSAPEFQKLSTKFIGLTRQKLMSLLKSIPIFAKLKHDPEKLNLLSELFSYQSHGPGAVVCREGSMGNSMHIIARGSVQVVAEGTGESARDVRCEGFLAKRGTRMKSHWKSRYFVLHNNCLTYSEPVSKDMTITVPSGLAVDGMDEGSESSDNLREGSIPSPTTTSPPTSPTGSQGASSRWAKLGKMVGGKQAASPTSSGSGSPTTSGDRPRTTSDFTSKGNISMYGISVAARSIKNVRLSKNERSLRRTSIVGGHCLPAEARRQKQVLYIIDARPWRGRQFGIEIILQGGASMFLCAPDEDSRDQWISCIRDGVSAAIHATALDAEAAQRRKVRGGDLARADGQTADEPEENESAAVVITQLQQGSYFGEIALVTDMPRTATVTTLEPTVLLVLHKKNFQNFLNLLPTFREEIEFITKQRTARNLKTLRLPFLDGFTDRRLALLAESSTIRQIEKDEVIFRQGDPGSSFYIILHGTVSVRATDSRVSNSSVSSVRSDASTGGTTSAPDNAGNRGDGAPLEVGDRGSSANAEAEIEINQLSTGEYFGEIALITEGARLATVVAVEPTSLMELSKESFETIFANDSDASVADFELRLFRHNSELQHVIKHPLGLQSFTAFLKKELSQENIEFYIAAEQYRTMWEQVPEADRSMRMLEMAKKLYKEYVEEVINIPSTMRVAIKKVIMSGDVTDCLFDDAIAEIYKLMERDNFQRYKKTDEFRKLLESVNAYGLKAKGRRSLNSSLSLARHKMKQIMDERRSSIKGRNSLSGPSTGYQAQEDNPPPRTRPKSATVTARPSKTGASAFAPLRPITEVSTGGSERSVNADPSVAGTNTEEAPSLTEDEEGAKATASDTSKKEQDPEDGKQEAQGDSGGTAKDKSSASTKGDATEEVKENLPKTAHQSAKELGSKTQSSTAPDESKDKAGGEGSESQKQTTPLPSESEKPNLQPKVEKEVAVSSRAPKSSDPASSAEGESDQGEAKKEEEETRPRFASARSLRRRSSAASEDDPTLPLGWEEDIEDGEKFYFYPPAGHWQPEHPAEHLSDPPLGWVLSEEDGKPFYLHAATGEWQWENPLKVGVEVPLPPGWVQSMEDGRPFYLNEETGDWQWLHPALGTEQ